MAAFKPENYSPLDPITHIMAGGPGPEALLGLHMPPEQALFETTAPGATSVVSARAEHTKMLEQFRKDGITVFNMREVIGKHLVPKAQHRFETPDLLLGEIKKRAEMLSQQHHLGDLDQTMVELEELLNIDVQTMGPDAAITINALLTGCITVDGQERSPLAGPPFANFLFWRDTNHITGDKLGSHRMFWPIRNQEVALAKAAFDALDVEHTPVPAPADPQEPFSIEGGDVMPFELNGERYAMIGTAERTSLAAVKAWYTLHEASFSPTGDGIIPVMVQGPLSNTQDQMHLDTFSQQVAPGAIVHCEALSKIRTANIITRDRHGDIVLVNPETFSDWIEKRATNVHSMTREQQLNYAANSLTHAGERVYMTRDDSPEVSDFIAAQGVKVIELRMQQLTKMYGGAHCATSEIRKRR